MSDINSGGGWAAIRYALRKAAEAGGIDKLYAALRTKNTCKTCALGMGGQRGGMRDESGHFPEVCKKSMQAMVADMQPPLPDDFFDRHDFNDLRRFTPYQLEHCGRLTRPLYAGPGDTGYRPISWNQAYGKCIDWLRASQPNENFFYMSGRSSNEAAFLLQLFARLYGTNNVNNCSYYCHQASGVGIGSALGTGTATVVLEDLKSCDLVFLIGGNPASNHPRLLRQLMAVRRRGGQVVVVNPLRETGLMRFRVPSDPRSLIFGSEIASLFLQPHIGGDIALLSGIAKAVAELGTTDESFVRDHTEGSESFLQMLSGLSWDQLCTDAGVREEDLRSAARLYAQSERTIFAWTMGITHHVHGVDNVRAIINLALLRGMVGKVGAGLLPIRGHSNVQGVGSVGVTPALKEKFFDNLQTHFGVKLPTTPGLDTLSCMEAMTAGEVRHGWCLGGNLYGANPDAAGAETACSQLESLVYFSTTLNTGHMRGRGQRTLVFPVLARDEEQQPTTQESMFNYVRLSDGGPRRLDGPRSEVHIIAHLAGSVLGWQYPIDWRRLTEHHNIREAIGAVVPGYGKIGQIDRLNEEFQIAGRTFHEPRFATPSGKARFHTLELPQRQSQPGHLILMTIRSEGQFNTVVYEEEDIYRNQQRRDVILISREDIDALGLEVDQPVTVRSGAGEMTNILVREFDIRPGNAAMYYPEANILVPSTADPESRTPAFKAVPVRVSASEAP